MHRIGFPSWRQVARSGGLQTIRVDVLLDDEAGVFVATSNDLRGLVCEAVTMDQLATEVDSSICELLTFQARGK